MLDRIAKFVGDVLTGKHPRSASRSTGERFRLDYEWVRERFHIRALDRSGTHIDLSCDEATALLTLLARHREGSWGRNALKNGFNERIGKWRWLRHRVRDNAYVLQGPREPDGYVPEIKLTAKEADVLIVELAARLHRLSTINA